MVMINANEISFPISSSLAYPFLSVQIESFVQLKRILIRKIIPNDEQITSDVYVILNCQERTNKPQDFFQLKRPEDPSNIYKWLWS